jgi:hypothetical protein
LFRYRERVVDLDAEIADGAFNFRVAQQKLDGPKVAGEPGASDAAHAAAARLCQLEKRSVMRGALAKVPASLIDPK